MVKGGVWGQRLGNKGRQTSEQAYAGRVDPNRLTGTWIQIARLDHDHFEECGTGSKAPIITFTETPGDATTLHVTMKCSNKYDGSEIRYDGTATTPNKYPSERGFAQMNLQLTNRNIHKAWTWVYARKGNFFVFDIPKGTAGSGPYEQIYVGAPNGKSFYFLARNPSAVSEADYAHWKGFAKRFKTSQIIRNYPENLAGSDHV